MHESKKIVIVGGNAAGPAAAAKAKRVNPNADVILFEAGNFISTGTCELPYLFSGEVDDYKKIIHYNPESFYKQKGVKVFINHYVKSIDPKIKKIEVIDNLSNNIYQYDYDKLILTTGSKPNEIPDLPFSLENVFSLKSVHDYLNINNYLKGSKVSKILIVGSGYIGLEVADSLKKSKYDITILEKEQLPFPQGEEEIQYLIKDLLEKNNIKFLIDNNQRKFIVKNNKFVQLKHDGRFIDFDLAIVSAGIKPNNQIAKNIGLKLGKFDGLIVDGRLKTSDPNIFAAGDNIEVKNFITKKIDYIPLATHAHLYGHIAGENACGGNKIADPVILNASFKLFDKFIAQVGLTQKNAKKYFINAQAVTEIANNKVKVMPNSQKVFGKIIFDKYSKQILGASFIGSEEISGYADLISAMIFNKTNVENLAKYNFNYTPTLSPFVNLLSILGRKIMEKI